MDITYEEILRKMNISPIIVNWLLDFWQNYQGDGTPLKKTADGKFVSVGWK